jgi:hypothetical protein
MNNFGKLEHKSQSEFIYDFLVKKFGTPIKIC